MNFEINNGWALAAFARLMRPLVRLALAKGLKHPQLDALLRELLLDEASRLWQKNGGIRPNVSQLSVTTGLNRKYVSLRVRDRQNNVSETVCPSLTSKVHTEWVQLAFHKPSLTTLPVTGASPSFEYHARATTHGDVHHRAILDELIRLGKAREFEGKAQLVGDVDVCDKNVQASLSLLVENCHDHLLAGVENLIVGQISYLERSVFGGPLSLQCCEEMQDSVRKD